MPLPFVLQVKSIKRNPEPDFIVAQVFQVFPCFTPGERQGKTESAILYCAPSFPPGERQGNRKLAGLYCCTVNDLFVAKNLCLENRHLKSSLLEKLCFKIVACAFQQKILVK
jgi:hypothetical protein